MFREMRRKDRQLTAAETARVFERGTSGTLALLGEDGYPYAVPLSYRYADGKIYFHSAKAGHKIDAIRSGEKASFCVIDQDQVVPGKYTTRFCSAIAFGKIRLMEEDAQKRAALTLLGEKYSPNDAAGLQREIEQTFSALCMIELTVEAMTGKSSLGPAAVQAD